MLISRTWKNDLALSLYNIGELLVYISPLFLIPIIISLIYAEPIQTTAMYVATSFLTVLLGLILKTLFDYAKKRQFSLRHALITIAIFWLVFPLLSAIPFILIINLNPLHSFFETMSALTTTGLSIISDLSVVPPSLIFWRSLISWVGGMGIVVLGLVGIFTAYSRSARLIVAEGRETKVRPNLRNALKEIWWIYILLTVIGIVLLIATGMPVFDSINYSMSAISTTGMDIDNIGLAFSTIPQQIVLGIIMLLGATSFAVHYLFIRRKQYAAYFKDTEFRLMVLFSIFTIFLVLTKIGKFDLPFVSALSFYVVSAFTCGGLLLTGLAPGLSSTTVSAVSTFFQDTFTKLSLIFLMFIGGSSGSTAGGLKISRFWILVKGFLWEAKKAILPKYSYFQMKSNDVVISLREFRKISYFAFMYLFFILLSALVLTYLGFEPINAIFEATSAQSNVGLTAGVTSPNMPVLGEVMLIFNMYVGRLEIIPVLALLGFFAGVFTRRL